MEILQVYKGQRGPICRLVYTREAQQNQKGYLQGAFLQYK